MNDRPRKSDAELIVDELRAIREELSKLTTAMGCVANPRACEDDEDDPDDDKLI